MSAVRSLPSTSRQFSFSPNGFCLLHAPGLWLPGRALAGAAAQDRVEVDPIGKLGQIK